MIILADYSRNSCYLKSFTDLKIKFNIMAIPHEHLDKFFFHFTHIKNLDSIVKNGFLSTNEKVRLAIDHKDVANGNIQERRHNMKVNIPPGGTIHDYVPFYFCSINPMLLSLVNHKNIDQMFMIFFAVPISKILDPNVIFTSASANTVIRPDFYTNPNDLDELNWESILSQKWSVKDDKDRHQKMAEALVFKSLPITDVDTIIVWNDGIKEHVEEVFKKNGIKCPTVTSQPFKKKSFYYTKFLMQRPRETLTTGPVWLKKIFEDQVENIIEKKSKQDDIEFRFESIEDLLVAIQKDFCILEELEGINGLETENEIHHENVSNHTLNVIAHLETNEYYLKSTPSDKNILKLSAYLHDIGKGPHSKWPKGKQKQYPDHPVDSLKMIKRILIKEIKNLSSYEIRMVCLLVGFHDIIGEIFGKSRDKKQLFKIIKSEKEFDMLDCLSYSDVKSFNNRWSLTYRQESNALKKELLDKIK